MEGQLWKAIVAMLTRIDKRPKRAREDFGDIDIVKTLYWAILHDRPINWSCRRENWPICLRRKPLPSDSTMSRRLRTPSVIALLDELERRVVKPSKAGMYWMIDGKPLVIGSCSKDHQAGYGRAATSMAKGYKLHAVTAPDGAVGAWRVAPMNKDERVIAARLLKTPQLQGYVVGDSNFDSNQLHEICDARGNVQLVTPRRYGPGKKVGHRSQSPGRLRSIALLENPEPRFGEALLHQRSDIERHFGNLTNWGGGLTHLPAWVRTHRRVRRWVQGKLVLTGLRRAIKQTTYVNP